MSLISGSYESNANQNIHLVGIPTYILSLFTAVILSSYHWSLFFIIAMIGDALYMWLFVLGYVTLVEKGDYFSKAQYFSVAIIVQLVFWISIMYWLLLR